MSCEPDTLVSLSLPNIFRRLSDGEFSDTDTVTVTVNNVAPMADNKTVTLDEDTTQVYLLNHKFRQ